jgi:hypothetical protein
MWTVISLRNLTLSSISLYLLAKIRHSCSRSPSSLTVAVVVDDEDISVSAVGFAVAVDAVDAVDVSVDAAMGEGVPTV